MKKKLILICAAVICCTIAYADEGMWMINAINRALETKMQERGLQLSANEIYNSDADGASLADAVVSLDFECTGSIISDQGLVITNHHCAYSDVHSLSTAEHNYLEEGFWAFRANEEIPVPGKRMLFLKKVIDVTEEAEKLKIELGIQGKPMGMRRLSHVMETRYSQETGLEASLSSMWSGSRYYMALYEVYSDIRLVAAPPVSIAAFGGDVDNWEWPQHKCDFAMYRIYTSADGKPAEFSENNVPMHSSSKLSICTKGINDGDFAMIIGYPGRTDRYSSSAKLSFQKDVSLPVSNKIRGEQMVIINRWMNSDPLIRLKYSDQYFMLSNVQELNEGEVLCYNRFNVLAEKKAQEVQMQQWIDSDPCRKSEWGELIGKLDSSYEAIADAEKNLILFRECIIRGCKLSLIATRLSTSKDPSKAGMMKKATRLTLKGMDMRVEKDIFRYCMEEYLNNIDPSYLGAFQRSLTESYKGDYNLMCNDLWDNSWMTDSLRMEEFLANDSEFDSYKEDSLYRFFTDVKIAEFNEKILGLQGDNTISTLGPEYTRVLYRMREDKGIVQYPDANSTMRITYGVVGGFRPRDGIWCDWKSTVAGLLEKHNPDEYDFCLKDGWRKALGTVTPDFNVDFLTDNDITGGNSGSPVLNARGELIGLAFDGNKESLAGDASFTQGYNKCVNVDIRFVIWTLKNYAHMDRIISEIGL